MFSVQRKVPVFTRLISLSVAFIFAWTFIVPLGYAQPVGGLPVLNLPAPGTMVTLSQPYTPVLMKGLTLYPDDPFKFDFIVDQGNAHLAQKEFKEESTKLVRYFMASMAMPNDDVWVNLAPDEQDRIIPDELAKTELGRDLLAQDYLLKQLSASLIYPEQDLGARFWEKVYAKARQLYGTTEIPVNTFNKVWIMPDSATVYEHGQTVYVVDSRVDTHGQARGTFIILSESKLRLP